MKFIDLFCGSGAFSHVLTKLGHTCVFANDIEKPCQKLYEANFSDNSHFVLGDITTIPVTSIPAHDILCAGFPCQPFSIAGKKDGFRDPRSNTFWSIVDILKTHKPKYILLENVKNLLTHDKGITKKIILDSLQELGYKITYNVLDTSKITEIPHHRERIYIVGVMNNFSVPINLNFESVECLPIKEFLTQNVEEKYYYTPRLKVYEVINREVTKTIEENYVYQYRRHYVREGNGKTCPTLTANMGVGGHNVPLLKDQKGVRKLTPKECFMLQGFPSSYNLIGSDANLYKIAGNAVSIPVIEKICKQFT